MRISAWALAGALAALSGAAAAEDIGTPRKAWDVASRVGVDQAGWRMTFRDPDTALFVRAEPESEDQFWVVSLSARFSVIHRSLYGVHCDDRTLQDLRSTTYSWDGERVGEGGAGPRSTPLPTSPIESVLNHVCASAAAVPGQ